jgi:pyrimidine operon attenuation protein/uracil phosphoribosyltransferase
MTEENPARTHIRRMAIDHREFAQVYRKWAESIAHAVDHRQPWAMVGIKRRGAIMARRLWNDFRDGFSLAGWKEAVFGELDISLYRDDYHLQASKPRVLGSEIPFSVDGRFILLVDDVLFTGRTVRAAIDQILDFGRPRKILLAAFIDRGHRELPIAADFVGKAIVTSLEDRVEVSLKEKEGEDRVEIIRPP